MTKDEAWQALKTSFLEIFPEFANQNIHPQSSLHELGANSIDRAEIIMLTLARLKLQIPLIEFASSKNLEGLVDILCHQK